MISRRDEDPFDAGVRSPAGRRSRRHIRQGKLGPGAGLPQVVGTYRAASPGGGRRDGGFYTAERIRHRAADRRHPRPRFLELGRSCVLKPYRNKRTVELLWHGIWSYVRAARRST